MKRPKSHHFEIEGQTFRGTSDKIIPAIEAAGYQAEREEENPNLFWNYSEHLKRTK